MGRIKILGNTSSKNLFIKGKINLSCKENNSKLKELIRLLLELLYARDVENHTENRRNHRETCRNDQSHIIAYT